MQIKESFEKFRVWTNEHYGLCAFVFSVIGLFATFWWLSGLKNDQIILNYKLSEVQRKLDKYEAEQEAETISNLSLQNDLREIKGYIRGVSDKNLKTVVEQNLLKYEVK